MEQLSSQLHFSQTSITPLMEHEGIVSAREFTIICPSDLSDSPECVNRLFCNISRPNARIYILPEKIVKLKAFSTYFRRFFIANIIPDIRLI